MADVLDGPSMFQAEAASIQKLLRRYLERMEREDLDAGREPRVRLFTHHRVAPDDDRGFERLADGRLRIRIEALHEFDFKGQFVRVREPGTEVLDLGVPELVMLAEGANSGDARRLGFEQHDVEVAGGDGRGPTVAQADFLAGLVEVLVGGRLRRRISSEFDDAGSEYWVRQIAVGHENDPEVGWVLVQVPDFKTFDPAEAGLVPAGTDTDSPEFFAAYQQMLYDYYIEQAADVLEIPRGELSTVEMIYGPKLFSLVERVGDDPRVAANAVVAGDTFGNGHFLTSGGAITGMVGHSQRVLEYWRAREAGSSPEEAIVRLAASIAEDTHAWLGVSAREYVEAAPINFGAERIAQLGADTSAHAASIDAARRQRHDLIPLNPSDWRRLFVHNGKVISSLPELGADNPLERPARTATLLAVMRSLPDVPAQANDVVMPPRNVTRLLSAADLAVEPQPSRSAPRAIGEVRAEGATAAAVLEIVQDGRPAARLPLPGPRAVIGRSDPASGINPDIDLTPFDPAGTVSRRHAVIRVDPDGAPSIEDLQSLNATQLGETALTPGARQDLRDGDMIRFGTVTAAFRLTGATPAAEPGRPTTSAGG